MSVCEGFCAHACAVVSCVVCVCKAVVISHQMAGIPLGKEGFSQKPVAPCVLGAVAELALVVGKTCWHISAC